MRNLRFIMPPWDWVGSFPGSSPGVAPYPGIFGSVAELTGGQHVPTEGQFEAGLAWRMGLHSGIGIYARIKLFKLEGHIALSNEGGIFLEGDIDLGVPAVTFYGTPMTSEEEITQHNGFHGFDDEHPDFGSISFKFARVCTIDSGIIFVPEIQIADSGIRVGKGYEEDNCFITGSLPVTHDGSWDGYSVSPDHVEEFSYEFQLGGPPGGEGGGTPGIIEGSLTLLPNPSGGFWEYDPDDGDGPVFNGDTGAWIRDPVDLLPR